jgi:hypothetical protein
MDSQNDYGFMRTGGGAPASDLNGINETEIKQLLSLFISNSLITATKYAKFCKRNGVTKDDINLGLKYEVREFFERSSLMEDIKDIQEEYQRLEDEEPIKFRVEYVDTRVGSIEESDIFETEDDAETFICEHEKHDFFTEFTIIELTESDIMMDDVVTEDSKIEPFTKITVDQIRDLNLEERQLVSKIHAHESSWSDWQPDTPLHMILKNGIETMMRSR